MEAEFLHATDFAQVIRYAPLVSIDILLKDPSGAVLLGLRNNEPAKGTYFVPGGVIRKNETRSASFERILKAELGLESSFDRARFIGAFEHFYETNRFGSPEYGTHYVVLAYELQLQDLPSIRTDDQHRHLRWMHPAEALSSASVHPYSKAYFEV